MLGIIFVFTILMFVFISGIISSQYIFLSRRSLEHTEALAQSLAANSISWILADDVIGLEEVILSQKSYPHIKYAMILSLRGRVMAHTETKIVGLFVQDPVSISLITADPVKQLLVNNYNLIDIAVPIFSGDSHIGWSRIAILQENLHSGLQQILLAGILIILFSIIIAVIFSAIMAKGITNGIQNILLVTQEVEQGELDISVVSDRPDELGQLGESLNKMIVRIKKSIDELDTYKNHLEQLVGQRTRELEGIKISLEQEVDEHKNAELTIKRQLNEKEIILKEVNHRIKNNFSSISSLLSMQADSLSNPEALAALQDAIGRVNSMYVLYENLLLSDDYQFTSVKDYLENLIDSIISIFPPNLNLKVEKIIDDFDLDTKRLIPVGIIVNEILTNTMKYAFEGRDSGNIQLTVKVNDNLVTLIIQDNGKGLPEGFDINKQTGFGLMLVTMLSEQLDAVLIVESLDGVRSTLEFQI